MNKKRLFRMISFILITLLAACNPAATPSVPVQVTPTLQMQANFAFRFEYGACLVEVIDTFSSTFTHDMGPTEADISIPVTLTDEQLTAIFERMAAINFFSYPENFAIPKPAHGSVGIVTPATHYFIQVQNGDALKMVSWTDEIFDPTTREADQLREFFQMIITMLGEISEIQKLPVPPVACL